jgi:hypothetical protein
MPRRHYQLCVVASAVREILFQPQSTLTSVAAAHQCCRRTLGRWLHWVAGIAKPSILIRRLGTLSSTEVFAARDNSRAIGTVTRKIVTRTATVFGLLEALGRAYGYEQSPFARMIERILSGRGRLTPYRFPAIPELAR